MSKQLYEEALADVKKVKEVAEDNAKRAILEAVTPRIRDMIEKEMLREAPAAPGSEEPEGELMTDDLPVDDLGAASELQPDAISPPDEEGKVTLDLDAVATDPSSGEYEVSLESVASLSPLLKATKSGAAKELELAMYRTSEAIEKFSKAGALVRESAGFKSQIAKMISRVEDMYEYVQESMSDPAKKSSYEKKLESYFSELNKLQESTMSHKKRMNEEDVTLKLTGLPDDIDLDSVGVDLITGDEEGEEGEDLDLGGEEGEEGGEGEEGEGCELDLDDLGGEEGGEESEEEPMEGRKLSDNTIVEIDEGMLRKEIARMRRLREEAAPSTKGVRPGSKEFDDFGDASSDGEALDVDIVDLSPAKAARPLGEADEDEPEGDDDGMKKELDELDAENEEVCAEIDQVGDRRTRDDFGASETSVPTEDKDNPAVRAESLKRRARFEKRLQERAKSRAASLKLEARRARARKDLKKEASLKREYALVAKRFNESVERSRKITSRLMVETKKLQNMTRSNSVSRRPAENNKAVATLRNRLAETNLVNAKLVYTNKLLQNESLTARQKAQVIQQLDSAKTVREAKLVYESLSRTLAGTSRSVNESATRRVIGSASRATRPASTQALNEGVEAERWAKLAGIVK